MVGVEMWGEVAGSMHNVFIDAIALGLVLAAFVLPVHFIFKWERGGFSAGVLSFWVLMTAGCFLLASDGVDVDLAPASYLAFGWLVGAMYCLPFYGVRKLIERRRRGRRTAGEPRNDG